MDHPSAVGNTVRSTRRVGVPLPSTFPNMEQNPSNDKRGGNGKDKKEGRIATWPQFTPKPVLQSGPSGRGQPFVDIQIRVAHKYNTIIILQLNF